MKKKPPVVKFPRSMEIPDPDDRHWTNGGDIEIAMYARSLHNAAKSLIASLDLQPNPAKAWNACPALLLYRQTLELHLKILIGEGVNFLPSSTDPITLYTTHSIRWLAQLVSQAVKHAGLEKDFRCEGVTNLVEFRALINEVDALDPVECAVTIGRSRRDGSVPAGLEPTNIVRLAGKLDGLLNLLDSTADALAATTDLTADDTGPGFTPTIQ